MLTYDEWDRINYEHDGEDFMDAYYNGEDWAIELAYENAHSEENYSDWY